MNQKRYAKLVQYKAALDSEWQRRNPVGINNDAYETTLRQAKMDSFKVLRNSKGEHKLVDTLEECKMDFTDMFGSAFGSGGIWIC
jgi:hypothetical protein